MEAIRNYLETMFGKLPNTPEVVKAKTVLGEMMEDKYEELIGSGKTENEAVGTVISEFGNLDELAEELGISEIMQEKDDETVSKISLENAKDFIRAKSTQAYMVGVGVMLCIISVTPFFFEGVAMNWRYASIAVCMMFVLIAAAVVLFVLGGAQMSKYRNINGKNNRIDYETAAFVEQQQENERMSNSIMQTIGIALCVMCVIPVILAGNVVGGNMLLAQAIGLTCMFLMIGIGVLLIIAACMKKGAYTRLLHSNPKEYVGGNYVKSQKERVQYSPVVENIFCVYWLTVACIYLCWSFLTFDWHITWIIWVIAPLVKKLIGYMGEKKDN